MLTHKDQLQLFTILSKKLTKDITCWAFGGNAMMFYGYKEETKDVDLLFENEKDRDEFITILKGMGFEETSPVTVYIPEKLKEKRKPIMLKRLDYRFDLFAKSIFRTELSPKMKEDKYAVHEFKGAKTLTVNVLRKEHLVLLKAVTSRDKDFQDIVTITTKEKGFDWQYLVDETVWQYAHGDSWALLEVEEKLKELKEYVFIEERYFKTLYDAEGEKE